MELLKQLFEIHSPSGREKKMKKFIRRYVRTNMPEVVIENDNKGNIYFTKGIADTYPCVVAHLDQVQDAHSKDFETFEHNGMIFGMSRKCRQQQGLGADDKNGLWICLKCLEEFDEIKVAMFVGEEVGCEGSSEANMSFFDNVRFVLQADRRGASDLITSIYGTPLATEEFLEDTNYKEFGYRPTTGMLTDVYTLRENVLNVCVLNISCGYYEPHTDNEVVCISDLLNCLEFVKNIIRNCKKVYKIEPCENKGYYGSLGSYGKYGSYGSYGSYGHYGSYGSYDSKNSFGKALEEEDEEIGGSYYDDREEEYFDETYWEDYIYNAILTYGAENASQLWEYCSYECEGLITKEKFIEIAEFWYS